MKKIKKIIFLAFLLFAFGAKAQTQNKSSQQSAKPTQEKRSVGMVHSEPTVAKQVQTTGSGYQLDENDPYQGRTQEFLSLLTVKELPSDFPKYNKNLGLGGYNALLDEFLATHKDIVIESVKRKLQSQGK